MEAIRNYLETMFLNLPNTPEVYKAKNELWQMMEDKYTELKNEGKSENEAVGTVIAEFGNLDELAEDLGIKQFVHQPRQGGDHLRDQRPGLPRHGADDRAGHFRRGHHEGTRKTTRN